MLWGIYLRIEINEQTNELNIIECLFTWIV